eukprot:TRINITY_DN48275_c0_g1_i1.p1 TRINITY_DN48275_c0_g1~~TRINITY_DN48275_c0_g1_i1.p1  ORF type:complete len:483 (+),score=57.33 TRINITY_DN48275_c0_g1_i1:73-1449(+)
MADVAPAGIAPGSSDDTTKELASKATLQVANLKTANETEAESGLCSKGVYYVLLFFVSWFGADAFDWDGDGDFDVHDARLIIQGKVRSLRHGFRTKIPSEPAQLTPADKGSRSNGNKPTDLASGHVETVFDSLASHTIGEAEEDRILRNVRNGRHWPMFSLCQCIVCISLWFIFAVRDVASGNTDERLGSAMGGIECVFTGGTMMQTHSDCEDQRAQVWRMLTYQFTHLGFSHVLCNCLLTFILGIPLEGLHGTRRIFLMFNIGVFGGACCCLVSAAHSSVVGMSGGCYALVGMHLADLVMNWRQKRFRWPTLALLVVSAGLDLFVSLGLTRGSTTTSHAAHFGGYVAGTFIGILLGKNLQVDRWERVLQVVVFGVGVVLVVSCFLWSSVHWPPRDIWRSLGYCWLRQVYNSSFSAEWACVRCEHQQCVAGWMQQKHINTVNINECLALDRWLDHRVY